MTYSCGKCGRTFDCGEPIFFCPFCGAAYASGEMPPTKIVIASDGGRTVQEEYWRKTGREIFKTLGLLEEKNSLWEKYSRQRIDLDDWSFRDCSSVAQFRQQCDGLIEKIAGLLRSGTAAKTTEPIDVQAAAEQFERVGMRLAEALGEAETLKRPSLILPSADAEAPSVPVPTADEWEPLLQAVESAQPRIYDMVGEYGLYVAQSAFADLSEEAPKDDLRALSGRLRALAEAKRDPLFGEGCDDFAQAFWESVQQLVQIANNANALIETDQNECAKLEALEAYAEQWKKALHLALDRAYQAQKVDMLDTSEKVCQIRTETEEALERENADARE